MNPADTITIGFKQNGRGIIPRPSSYISVPVYVSIRALSRDQKSWDGRQNLSESCVRNRMCDFRAVSEYRIIPRVKLIPMPSRISRKGRVVESQLTSTLLFGTDLIGPEWRAGGVGLDSSSDLIF